MQKESGESKERQHLLRGHSKFLLEYSLIARSTLVRTFLAEDFVYYLELQNVG